MRYYLKAIEREGRAHWDGGSSPREPGRSAICSPPPSPRAPSPAACSGGDCRAAMLRAFCCLGLKLSRSLGDGVVTVLLHPTLTKSQLEGTLGKFPLVSSARAEERTGRGSLAVTPPPPGSYFYWSKEPSVMSSLPVARLYWIWRPFVSAGGGRFSGLRRGGARRGSRLQSARL